MLRPRPSDEGTGALRELAWRLAGALPLLLVGFLLLRAGGRRLAEGPDALVWALVLGGIGCAGLLVGGALVAFKLNDLFAANIASLVWGGMRTGAERTEFSAAAALAAEGRYEDAVAEYRRLAKRRGTSLRAYCAVLALCAARGDPRAESIFRQAQRDLPDRRSRERLNEVYGFYRNDRDPAHTRRSAGSPHALGESNAARSAPAWRSGNE